MTESKIRNMAADFSVDIIKICEKIKVHRSLADQLLRAGTSIGANIHEANYAQSKADFVSKLQIALKECYETEYWLELFEKANLLAPDVTEELSHKCGKIRRYLIASIDTAKGSTARSNVLP